jgi:hypothetical protein
MTIVMDSFIRETFRKQMRTLREFPKDEKHRLITILSKGHLESLPLLKPSFVGITNGRTALFVLQYKWMR